MAIIVRKNKGDSKDDIIGKFRRIYLEEDITEEVKKRTAYSKPSIGRYAKKKLFCGGKNAAGEQKNQGSMVKDKIRQDSVVALKAGEGRKVEILRFLISVLDKRELSLPAGKMTPEEEIGVLRKEMKHKEEAREMFAKGGRDDLVAEIDEEIKILKDYLPAEIGDDEIRKVVLEVVGAQSITPVPFGAVMSETMRRLAGGAGGDRVSSIVKECLTES